MPKRLPSVWFADPHTIAKIEILKGYLNAWFRILAKTRSKQTILYIDGFAGPGHYTNHEEGSPLAAANIAVRTIETLGDEFIAKELYCAFIESDKKRFDVLTKNLKAYDGKLKLTIDPKHCEFADGIDRIRASVPGPFTGKSPLFVFADPFGGTGIPFKTFARCMEGDSSELLINLDSDGIGRIFAANNPNREEQLGELFGDESWREALIAGDDLKQLSIQILNLYKRRLKLVTRFVWSFAMRGSRDLINYHLIFATKHPLGLEKMKAAMKAIDKTGSYSFSDADVGQHVLFRDDNDAIYADKLFNEFNGKTVSYNEAHLFALNETPFTNPKSMLLYLENKLWLKVEPQPGAARRSGTFVEEKIKSLQFGRFSDIHEQLGLL